MTPKEKRIVAGLARRLVKFLAERRAMVTILKQAEAENRPPTDWLEELETLRQTPEYRAVVEANEPMILQLEQGADIDEILPLLEQFAKGKLPN
jgi:hypothetical protein